MYEITIPRQIKCLGFDFGHVKFRYSNGYMVMSARDDNIFNKMYETAREEDSIFSNRKCGWYHL